MNFRKFLEGSIELTSPVLPKDIQINKKYIKGGIPDPTPSDLPKINPPKYYDIDYGPKFSYIITNLVENQNAMIAMLVHCNQITQNLYPNPITKKTIQVLKNKNIQDIQDFHQEINSYPPDSTNETFLAWTIAYYSTLFPNQSYANIITSTIIVIQDTAELVNRLINQNIQEQLYQYAEYLIFSKITKSPIPKSDKKELKRLSKLKSLKPNDVNHILILLNDKEYIYNLLTYISKLTNTNINDTVQLLKNDNTYHPLLQHWIRQFLET